MIFVGTEVDHNYNSLVEFQKAFEPDSLDPSQRGKATVHTEDLLAVNQFNIPTGYKFSDYSWCAYFFLQMN